MSSAQAPDGVWVLPVSLRWFSGILLALSLAGMLLLVFRAMLDHDEMEHLHAAWNMLQGQRVYIDFFEHHPPFWWEFLRLNLAVLGEKIEVFYVARLWMFAAFIATALGTWRLGKLMQGDAMGVSAAFSLLAIQASHRLATESRPDGFMVAGMIWGLCLIFESWRGRWSFGKVLLGLTLLSAATAFHPRSLFTLAATGLFVLVHPVPGQPWSLQARLRQVPALALVVAVPLLIPVLFYGGWHYIHEVYIVSAKAYPPAPGTGEKMELLMNFPVMPVGLAGLLIALHGSLSKHQTQASQASDRLLTLILVLNILGVLTSKRVFAQTLFVCLPFAALAAGRTVHAIISSMHRHQAASLAGYVVWCVVEIAGIIAIYPAGQPLQEHLAYLRQANQQLPRDARYVGPMLFHPIFRHDGSRYWFEFDLRTLKMADPGFTHDFVAEFQNQKPLWVHAGFLQRVAQHSFEQAKVIKKLLDAQYQPHESLPLLVRQSP